jgi:hypothetical protein
LKEGASPAVLPPDESEMKQIVSCSCSVIITIILGLSAVAQVQSKTPVRDLGITRSYGVSAQIFDAVVDVKDLQKGVGHFLLNTVGKCRKKAQEMGKSAQSIAGMGGNWLEYGVLIALKEKKLTPAFWQAEFAAVPNAFNDVMLFSKEHGPIILSCKTSLRERYKQADLEAVALRAHFPQAKFYLLTLDDDKSHVARVREKITNKELLALQRVYDESNVDELFAFLKTLTLMEPPPKTLRSGKVVK